jgi:hypothetical protein
MNRDVHSVLGLQHRVVVGHVVDVSEAYAASILGIISNHYVSIRWPDTALRDR